MKKKLLYIFLITIILAGTLPSTAYAAAPSNDNFADATEFFDSLGSTGIFYTDSVDVTDATEEVDDPAVHTTCGTNPNLKPGLKSVWYKYTPTENTSLLVDTFGSNYDTYVAVWTHPSAQFNFVACADDSQGYTQTLVGFSAFAGTTYYIEVAKTTGAISDTSLNSQSDVDAQGVWDLVFNVRYYSASEEFLIRSISSQDGWILEKNENSGAGRKLNKGSQVLKIGDNAANKQFRSILSFDTSALPDGAVIVSAALTFKYASVAGTNPFTTHGNLLVDIRNGSFSDNPALQRGDFKNAASKNKVLSYTNNKVNKWYSQSLSADDFQYINLTGMTQFRLRFNIDDNNDSGTDCLKIYSGNAGVASRPKLIIQYYVAEN